MTLASTPVRRPSGGQHTVAGVAIILGAALLIAAIADCTDGADAAWPLALIGCVLGLAGLVVRGVTDPPAVAGPSSILGTMAVVFFFAVVVSTFVYLATGAVTDLSSALFESVAGFSTTALSVFDDPSRAPRGVLLWRTMTQWLGGLGAVIALVGLLPELGVGAPEPVRGAVGVHDQPWRRSNRRLNRLLVRLAWVYGTLTVIGGVLLAAAGLGPFDALSVAMTTVSTGGFSDYSDSIAHFDSAVVEWTVLGGMAVSGASLALLWRGVTGSVSGLLRSVELRAYVAVLVSAGLVSAVMTAPDGGMTHRSVRHAFFSVASAVSTTGHTVVDWTTWSVGLQMLLVCVMAVGAMSGSAGGGFRVLRALTMVSVVRREIAAQLDPHRVVVVKVGQQVIPEGVISRMVGFQVLSVLLVVGGSVGLAASGIDLVGAGAGAIAALSTVGPGLGDLGPGRSVMHQPVPVQLTLIALMSAGRLEVYPIARLATGLTARARRGARSLVHRS